jgi:phenylalanyl-tRNA synthetase beta chain
MKVPYSWLKEMVPCELPAEELAEKLTMQGVSVEGIEHLGKGLEDIKVAQVVTCEQHPNADRLTFCRVTDGEREYEIVCGATNHKAETRWPWPCREPVFRVWKASRLRKRKSGASNPAG